MQHSLDVLRMLIPRPVGQDAEGREVSMVCHLWLNDASLYHQYIIIPLSLYHYIIIYIRLSYSMTGVSPWYLLGISLVSPWRPLSRSPPGGPLLGPGCSAWRTTASLAPLTVTRKRSSSTAHGSHGYDGYDGYY